MSSIDHRYTQQEQTTLLDIAEQSIEHGLRTGNALSVKTSNYPPPLQEQRATFVTLKKHGDLRGCIGTLSPVRPLVDDVAYNAFASAFEDPRFGPLQAHEKSTLEISISILSLPEPLEIASEQDLINKIIPGVHGLILSEGYHRGTFLPSVWDSLPDPQQFVSHLKLKAGLPSDYWSPQIKIETYVTFSFSRQCNSAINP